MLARKARPRSWKGCTSTIQSQCSYAVHRNRYFGPLPISENGNEYIIVLGEYFPKWVEAWAVPDHAAQTVADKLVCEFITKYGCPQQIHTDQGREF